MNKTCPQCNKSFSITTRHKLCSTCRKQNYKIPCPICNQPIRPNSKTCSSCRPKTGSSNPAWKGGKSRHKKGYILQYQPQHPRSKSNGGYVFEHILIIEKFLGRFLLEGETVHHINGVKDDNRIENLELWTTNHPSGVRVEDSIERALELLKEYLPDSLMPNYR